MNKITSSKELMKYLSKIKYINKGGCGLAGLVLYDMFNKEGKKPQIVYCYTRYNLDRSSSFEDNEKFIKSKTGTPESCSHVVIKVGGKYYDSYGENTKFFKENYQKFQKVSREHLRLSLIYGSWNEDFDLLKGMKRLQKVTDTDFTTLL